MTNLTKGCDLHFNVSGNKGNGCTCFANQNIGQNWKCVSTFNNAGDHL